MRKAFYWGMFIAVMVVAYLGLKAQTAPTGPVVLGYTPSSQAVLMFADGSTILPPIPPNPARVPPQDSNDIYVVFNQFGRAVCAPVNGVTPAVCTQFKITAGK